MKSEKAREFIDDLFFQPKKETQQPTIVRAPNNRRYYNEAVELAEAEMRERAIEAYCQLCNEETNSCPCRYPSVCEKRDIFIHALDNHKTIK